MPSYLLTAKRIGFSVVDLDEISIGMLLDVVIEASGSAIEETTQADIDKFFV